MRTDLGRLTRTIRPTTTSVSGRLGTFLAITRETRVTSWATETIHRSTCTIVAPTVRGRTTSVIPRSSDIFCTGAVVGGPDSADDFDYDDDRGDFRRNEVAVDYNSGFTGAVARLYQEFGGNPIPDSQFPPPEGPFEEYLVSAKVNASNARFVEIKAVIQNRSTAPARVRDDLFFRYFVDLTEAVQAGVAPADIVVSTAFNQGTSVSALQSWGNPADNIYYVEISFAGVTIYPGGQSEFRREVQFRMTLPLNAGVNWDNSNDHSWDPAFATTSQTFGVVAARIPVYGADGRLFGEEPTDCGPGTGVNCVPNALSADLATTTGVAISVSLDGTDEDGTIASRTVIAGPDSGTLTGSGAVRTYSPNPGFSGTDRIEFTVTDDAGATSAPAAITIRVDPPQVPSVAITGPPANSQVTAGGPFTVTYASANVAGVQASINGTVAASGSGGSVSLTAPAAPGAFTVSLQGVDAAGNPLNAVDSVTLSAVAALPTVSIVTPAANTTFPVGSTFVVTYNASDVAAVRVSVAGVVIGSSTGGSVTVTAPASPGAFAVELTGLDAAGNVLSASDAVTLSAVAPSASCAFVIDNEWPDGFVAKIIISNATAQAITGWQVGWSFTDGSTVANLWNANLSGTNPYSASPVSWNATIAPGQSVEFGFVGNKGTVNTPAPTPTVSGAVCN